MIETRRKREWDRERERERAGKRQGQPEWHLKASLMGCWTVAEGGGEVWQKGESKA